ncbi:MAG TPA: sulfotransferase [Solirubrobacteraceae bacterium]|nr:sulfotransferase [Solirubrobacteraceae bacterium]
MIGAGLGRTGTTSLKLALEQLLDAPCHHMIDVQENHWQDAVWLAAVRGEPDCMQRLLDGYAAVVDWPGSAFWEPLSELHPDARVLLSTRETAAQWWSSYERTILQSVTSPPPADEPQRGPHREMVRELLSTCFAAGWQQRDEAVAAYERHNARVRASVEPGRLIEWQPGAGWEPICRALARAVPDAAFPRENSAAEFRTRNLGS